MTRRYSRSILLITGILAAAMPAAGAESRIQFLDDGAGQIACAIDDNVAFT